MSRKTAQQIVEIQSRRETDSDEKRTDTQDVSILQYGNAS